MTQDEQKQRYSRWFPHCKFEKKNSGYTITINIKKFVAVKIIQIDESKNHKVMICLNVQRPNGLETFGNHTAIYSSIEDIAEAINNLLSFYCYDMKSNLKRDNDLPVSFTWDNNEVNQLINNSIQLYEKYGH